MSIISRRPSDTAVDIFPCDGSLLRATDTSPKPKASHTSLAANQAVFARTAILNFWSWVKRVVMYKSLIYQNKLKSISL